MKKIFSFILVMCLIGAVASCKGKNKGAGGGASGSDSTESTSAADRSCSPIEDSLSQKMGSAFGTQLNLGFKNDNIDLDKDQLLKAFETVLLLDTTKHDRSYIQGLQIAIQIYGQISQLESQGISVNRSLVLDELKKAFNSNDSVDIMRSQIMTSEIQELTQKALKVKGQENESEGQKYLQEQMKNDKGFKSTTSGLAYKVLKEGSGENFKETDVVDVIYVGKHINGKEFDNSKGKPVPMPMQQLTPGFREVLTLMKPGSKVIAIIPGKLAYGEIGDPRAGIGPNETLVFEITAVGVSAPQDAAVGYPSIQK